MIRRSLVLLALAVACCSDDSTPVKNDNGAPLVDGQAVNPEAGSSCTEGNKICASQYQVRICQGGRYVDFEDCSTKKDAYGNTCQCSVTFMGACQYAGKVCP